MSLGALKKKQDWRVSILPLFPGGHVTTPAEWHQGPLQKCNDNQSWSKSWRFCMFPWTPKRKISRFKEIEDEPTQQQPHFPNSESQRTPDPNSKSFTAPLPKKFCKPYLRTKLRSWEKLRACISIQVKLSRWGIQSKLQLVRSLVHVTVKPEGTPLWTGKYLAALSQMESQGIQTYIASLNIAWKNWRLTCSKLITFHQHQYGLISLYSWFTSWISCLCLLR